MQPAARFMYLCLWGGKKKNLLWTIAREAGLNLDENYNWIEFNVLLFSSLVGQHIACAKSTVKNQSLCMLRSQKVFRTGVGEFVILLDGIMLIDFKSIREN